jgi:hypothetical protein
MMFCTHLLQSTYIDVIYDAILLIFSVLLDGNDRLIICWAIDLLIAS